MKTNKSNDDEPDEAKGLWADVKDDEVMETEKETPQGQAQEDQKLGQARQDDKEPKQDDIKDVKVIKPEPERANDEEKPNWNSRDPYWTEGGQSSGSSGSAATPMQPQPPLAPFNAFQPPRGARVPSQGLVDFLEAMVDLMYQYNLYQEIWEERTLNDIKQIPVELMSKLGDEDFNMVPGITWKFFIEAVEGCNPFSRHVAWFQLIYGRFFLANN